MAASALCVGSSEIPRFGILGRIGRDLCATLTSSLSDNRQIAGKCMSGIRRHAPAPLILRMATHALRLRSGMPSQLGWRKEVSLWTRISSRKAGTLETVSPDPGSPLWLLVRAAP